jgi:signal transduction histidine kinase
VTAVGPVPGPVGSGGAGTGTGVGGVHLCAGGGVGPGDEVGAGGGVGSRGGRAAAGVRRWWLRVREDLRPLDPVRSIKVKLGLLVVASVASGALMTWYGLLILGLWPRYTLPVVVLVALLVTQLLAHGMTSPLRQMTAAARSMAAGRPPTPVRATSRDEVGDLARAFTAMAADLATADAQRRELMANVSHELRTPVTAVRAQLENLVDGVREADGQALGELLDQVERLGELVEDLLDLARAEAGVSPLAPRPVPVRSLVENVAAEVGVVHPGHRLTVDVPADLIAHADPARLRQVLVNLVENAARHGGSGGRIDVLARAAAPGLLIEVTDDGPGIPREQWNAVFERFRRGGNEDGGTGLGLAIARWAVGLHGGEISVVPAPRGCRIRATLPAARPG